MDRDAYFVVQTVEGERFTGEGAFGLNRRGQLVTAAGQPVLEVQRATFVQKKFSAAD